jgi:hypothetical protein
MAMLPALSTATLGSQRFVAFGLYVAAWIAFPTVPPVTGTW